MLSTNLLLAVCLGYVAILFAVAFWVDRRAGQGGLVWLRSPVVYTLSISVYCTSWTFYGAVGSAARSGLEFVTIYTGPTLVFIGWWWLLRKLVRIGRVHRITSIADLISSRYGKSSALAVLVTLIAVIAITPYIALQLQSVTRSYQAVAGRVDGAITAFWVAAGLAVFAVMFGTRSLDANERHHGVIAAIAFEAIVKLVALIAVGIFAVWGVAGGIGEVFADAPPQILAAGDIFGPRWVVLTFLAATAVICLPRQFQVTVVENVEERHLATASWLFPLYLFLMCLAILPIAAAGLKFLPEGANPDLFVLTLPLARHREELALLAFLGGFSSATSMVIVAAIAVSTMVSNHIVAPLALRFLSGRAEVSGDVRQLLLMTRRISIAVILALGFLYFRLTGGSGALAAIGLIAFVGVAQFLPSLVGGLFWRGATRAGALSGLIAGFVLWAYTLFLPSFGDDFLGQAVLESGPWGLSALRPQALLGLTGHDPLVHAVIWSLGVNTFLFLVVSGLSGTRPIERLQAVLFVDVFRTSGEPTHFGGGAAASEDLFVLAQRILGADPARRLFDRMARQQGRPGHLPAPTDAMIGRLERELSGSVGAASAHAMVSRLAGGERVGIPELIDIAGETQRLIETSRELAEKSSELERAAVALREANDRLRTLDAQKDEFLSQISHELRTPMTSIRSFSEILLEGDAVGEADRRRFLAIIHDESERLTRLLDEILDISRLEAGTFELTFGPIDPEPVIAAAIATVSGMTGKNGIEMRHVPGPGVVSVQANADRLRQVLINLLSNAVKYNTAPRPEITVRTTIGAGFLYVDVIDNGGGVGHDEAAMVFEKFNRGARPRRGSGVGLGLPISRALMRRMGGDLTVLFTRADAGYFRVVLRRAGPQPRLAAPAQG